MDTPAPTIDGQVVELIEAHRPALERYVRKLVRDPDEAADIVQETCVRLLVAGRGGFIPDWPAAWMNRVAHNLVVSAARHRQIAQREAEHLVSANLSRATEDDIVGRERDAEVFRALASASPEDRDALVLAASGYRSKEIAFRLGRSDGATRTLLSRARGRLRRSLEAAGAA